MPTYATKKHIVAVTEGSGSAWIVKVFRKRPFFKKLISSDWFLDADQARRFVQEMLPSLDRDETAGLLLSRKPGWILRRPSH